MSIDSSTSGASPAKRPVISLKFLVVSLLLAVLAGGGFLGYIFWEEFSKHDPKAFRTEKLWREENPEEYKKMMEGRGNRNGPPPSISGESGGGGGGGGGEGGGRRRGRPESSTEESKDAPADAAAESKDAPKEEADAKPAEGETPAADAPKEEPAKEGDGGK